MRYLCTVRQRDRDRARERERVKERERERDSESERERGCTERGRTIIERKREKKRARARERETEREREREREGERTHRASVLPRRLATARRLRVGLCEHTEGGCECVCVGERAMAEWLVHRARDAAATWKSLEGERVCVRVCVRERAWPRRAAFASVSANIHRLV